jgi:hypothetical protein
VLVICNCHLGFCNCACDKHCTAQLLEYQSLLEFYSISVDYRQEFVGPLLIDVFVSCCSFSNSAVMGRINWFPGHMAKAFHALNRIIKGVDMVLEVRDARVSADANWGLSSRSSSSQEPVSTLTWLPRSARADTVFFL